MLDEKNASNSYLAAGEEKIEEISLFSKEGIFVWENVCERIAETR